MTPDAVPELALMKSLKPGEVVGLLTDTFEALSSDKSYRDGVGRFVPGAGMVYGVRVPQLRALAQQINKAYGKQAGFVEDIADRCWQIGSREHRVLGILILSGLKSLTADDRWMLGTRYLPDVGDWETCDQLCMGLLGQALAEAPGYMEEIENWVEEPNFWVRRAALASTVILRRSKAGPEIRASLDRRTLGICLRLLDDAEHYVRKALDWAVREVIHRHYELGRDWLIERSKTDLSPVARSTLKKAAKKLAPPDQARFLKNLS